MKSWANSAALICRHTMQVITLWFAVLSSISAIAETGTAVNQCETNAAFCGVCQRSSLTNTGDSIQSAASQHYEIQKTLCPSVGSDQRLIEVAATSLDCTATLKAGAVPTCLPPEMHHLSNLQNGLGPMGFVAGDSKTRSKFYVFYGTRPQGPHLRPAITGDIFKTAVLGQTSQAIYNDLVAGQKVSLVGHSQGAISVQVAAYFAVKKYFRIYKKFPEGRLKLVLFGSPGASEILRQMDPEFNPKIFDGMTKYSFASDGDPIATINTALFPSLVIPSEKPPLIKFANYTHKNESTELAMIGNVSHHRMRYYDKAVMSGRICAAKSQQLQPKTMVIDGNSLVYKMARLFQ